MVDEIRNTAKEPSLFFYYLVITFCYIFLYSLMKKARNMQKLGILEVGMENKMFYSS